MTLVTRWWWIRHAPVRSGGRIYGNDDPPADCADLDCATATACQAPPKDDKGGCGCQFTRSSELPILLLLLVLALLHKRRKVRKQ